MFTLHTIILKKNWGEKKDKLNKFRKQKQIRKVESLTVGEAFKAIL